MLRSLFVSSLFVLSLSIAGLASAADKAPLRIAFIDPVSGPAANLGLPALAQMRFDAKRINQAGGINGHPLEIVVMDDKMTPKQALVELQKATDDGIRYVVQGMASSVASALQSGVDKYNQRNPAKPVLYFNYSATDPVLTGERCSFWSFRFIGNTYMTMNVLTNWVATHKDIHKIFLINPDYSFGHAVAESARRMLKEKRPDVKIVGSAFQPTLKVKDFSPYITQIKASGADAVITGNFGNDMSLLVKAAASYGLDIPILTYFGNSPGTVATVGESAVGRLYVAADAAGDYTNPIIAQRQVKLHKESGWDLNMPRITYMLEMLQQAAKKADSIDPVKVAFALEGMKYDSLRGEVIMRAKDHQILLPYYVSVLKDGMKIGADGTNGLNFHTLKKYSAQEVALPTTCQMRRPKQ